MLNRVLLDLLNSGKKIILFGAGKFGELAASLFSVYIPQYFVDNDPLKHNKQISGITVFPVSKLNEEEKDKIFILVTTFLSNDIITQLDNMGLKKRIHYDSIVDFIPRIATIDKDIIDHCTLVMSEFISKDYKDSKNNTVTMIDEGGNSEYTIFFAGENNKIKIAPKCCFRNLIVNFRGNNSFITIDEECWFREGNIDAGSGVNISIGKKFSAEGFAISARESGTVSIGDDCMFSYGILIFQSDTHPIFDKTTDKRINKGKNIKIGNHVWLGANSSIVGGSEIGDGSVIGLGSVVAGSIPSHVTAAGNPARVRRENIIWLKKELINEM